MFRQAGLGAMGNDRAKRVGIGRATWVLEEFSHGMAGRAFAGYYLETNQRLRIDGGIPCVVCETVTCLGGIVVTVLFAFAPSRRHVLFGGEADALGKDGNGSRCESCLFDEAPACNVVFWYASYLEGDVRSLFIRLMGKLAEGGLMRQGPTGVTDNLGCCARFDPILVSPVCVQRVLSPE